MKTVYKEDNDEKPYQDSILEEEKGELSIETKEE
jgi:hypothetical protein